MSIASSPDVINGNPRLQGNRLSVLDFVFELHLRGKQKFLQDFPEFNTEIIREILQFCSERVCDEIGEHCGGCSLRMIQDQVNSLQEFIDRYQELYFEDSEEIIEGKGDGVIIMPGTPEDLSSTWKGVDGWLLAEDIKE